MIRYSFAIFLGAFLLFLVQPLTARVLLPVFGGTATVWTACMVCFQSMLLVGYVYAHFVRTVFSPRWGWIVHSLALILAWILWRPLLLEGNPRMEPLAAAVAWKLMVAAGVPLIVLSATGPLVQAWSSSSHRNRDSYRLYAVSNSGSLLALLVYPFVFDWFLPVSIQIRLWTIAFGLFTLAMIASGMQVRNFSNWMQKDAIVGSVEKTLDPWRIPDWIIWPAIASVILMSVTNLLCQELASWPFLWVWPLVFYLLGMIICFDRPKSYRRGVMAGLFMCCNFAGILLYHLGTNAGLAWQVFGSAALVFSSSMVCHGELVRVRPTTQRLTLFYLCVALGGAGGGVFSTVVAPAVFNGYYDFHVGLLACLGMFAVTVWRERTSAKGSWSPVSVPNALASLAAVPVVCSLLFELSPEFQRNVLFRKRNEYGMVTVKDYGDHRLLFSGQTNHGGQSAGDNVGQPYAYYSSGSGAALAFETVRHWKQDDAKEVSAGLNIGVIGLGTGALEAYGESHDRFRFYEINPLVLEAAEEYFNWIHNQQTRIVLGDGRIELARELKETGSKGFDILFVDAFTSDSIPVHLLTSECFDIYSRHLDPHGIIVVHITNRYVDLRQPLCNMALAKNMHAVLLEHKDSGSDIHTRWVLLSKDGRLETEPKLRDAAVQWPGAPTQLCWTDDFASPASQVIWLRAGHHERQVQHASQ